MSVLYVVATPIGNLQDITPRAIDTLQNSDIILCEDTRTSKKLLLAYDIKKNLVSYHKFNEYSRSKEFIEKMKKEDLTVSLITDAGTPCISDPGAYIVNSARENNIDVYVIPGASAVISALSVSGIFFNQFSFLGFFPREKSEQKALIQNITDSFIDTFVIYESPKRIADTVKVLSDAFTDSQIICCNDLTKKFEKYYYGKPKEVLEQLENNTLSELGEYVICLNVANSKSHFATVKKEYLESKLVECMLEYDCSLKTAIDILKMQYSKNELYKASLKLKSLFEE